MRARSLLLLAFVLAIALFIGYLFFADNSIYRRNFGDHVVKIWIGADDAGSDQQKIHGSYHQRGFILMYPYNSVELPREFVQPTFSTVVDDANQLICVHDDNDYGFLMIVDQSDHDSYIGGMSGGVKISGPEKWQRHFQILQAKNPNIPYAEYFKSSEDDG